MVRVFMVYEQEPDLSRYEQHADLCRRVPGGSTIVSRPAATLDELSLEEWQALLHFNLTATFLLSHAVVPVMKRQGAGKIVNLASIAGRGVSQSSSSAYATAKGGIIALTRKLAFELGPHGVTVQAIAPSPTPSERLRPRWDRLPPRPPRSAGRRSGGWPPRRTRPGSSASSPPPTPTS
jgi:NAD(P)-dependent dehydrogenase (short-subunit alcohol dehydrogenase family)